MCVYVYVCVCVFVCVRGYVSVCMHMCASAYVNVCMHLCAVCVYLLHDFSEVAPFSQQLSIEIGVRLCAPPLPLLLPLLGIV